MPDNQVIAIFKSMVEEGRLDKKKPHIPVVKKMHTPEHFEQISMWDILEEGKDNSNV